jgi:hypothetical protein
MCNTLKEWMIKHFSHNEMADMVNHGVPRSSLGMCYCLEIPDLYLKYKQELNALIEDGNLCCDTCKMLDRYYKRYAVAIEAIDVQRRKIVLTKFQRMMHKLRRRHNRNGKRLLYCNNDMQLVHKFIEEYDEYQIKHSNNLVFWMGAEIVALQLTQGVYLDKDRYL